MESRLRLIVHSWDFDGMLASAFYSEVLKTLIIDAASAKRSLTEDDYDKLANAILAQYPEFFNKRFEQDLAAEHIVFIGSDRQDVMTDLNNGMKMGVDLYATLSCYPFFEALINALRNKYHVNIQLDKLLLEDIYQKRVVGTSFDQIKSAYLHLDASLYQEIAKQLTSYQSNEANELFFALKKELSELTKNREDALRLPQYTDKSKLLIMYAQIHRAHAIYSRGREFSYHYADDRFDILTAAEKNLSFVLAYLPSKTHVYLEQFIPPEMIKVLQKSSADNIFFSEYQQTTKIIGTCEEEQDDETFIRDIATTHSSLNVIFDNPVPDILLTTVKNRLRDKAIMHIQHCINDLVSQDSSSCLKKINQLLNEYNSSQEATSNVVLLKNIRKIVKKELGSKFSNSFNQHKKNPMTATFYQALRNFDPDQPDTTGLVAAYHVIHHQPSPTIRRKGSWLSLSGKK